MRRALTPGRAHPFAANLAPDTFNPEKAADLWRVKFVATALLATCVLIALTARALEPRFQAFSYVAAWAEAATVGGLADWYAVVALFRHPLGLPIPHTAVITSNRARIAESFGAFVRDQFLKPEPIAEKLHSVDFAALAASWIADERRSAALAQFGLSLLPQALTAIEATGLRQFMGNRVMHELRTLELAPIVARVLAAFIEDQRHQKLFELVLSGLRELIDDERLREAIREKIRIELPMTFNLIRADAYLVRRFAKLASTAIDEALDNPQHPFRRDFDRFARDFVAKLGSSPEYAERANEIKRDFLSRPEVADLAKDSWESVVAFLQNEARSGDSILERQLARFLAEVGLMLANEPVIRNELNAGVETALLTFIATNKQEIARFITDQINAWDVEAMIWIIELNFGLDLQFIRLNGTFVGGLAGLVLYTAERALRTGS